MNITQKIKNFFIGFTEYLFPKYITCCFCGDELREKGLICPRCIKQLPFIQKPCLKCGSMIPSGDYCIRCKNINFNFDRCVSVCDYDSFVKKIIYKFKNGDKYLYQPISLLIKEKIYGAGIDIDLLACVPLTKKVLRRRGFNQSGLIMRYLSKNLNIACHEGFYKIRESDFQKNITAKQRQENVKGAFLLENKKNIAGKNVLIVDDVITTGSTLNECARLFKNAGANKVYCCTFAAVKAVISYEKPLLKDV